MTPLVYEMTQGDPFYAEIAFVDQYGVPVDLSSWALSANFKLAYFDAVPFLDLSILGGGLITVATGVIGLEFPAAAVADIDINPSPRNGDLVPWRWIYGDLKLSPPANVEFAQGDGSRTSILIKLFMGVS